MKKMSNKTKTIITCLLFVLFIAGASFLYQYLKNATDTAPDNLRVETNKGDVDAPKADQANNPSPDPDSAEEEKTEAFDFTVVDADGNEVSLSSFFGKPIVLNFWASWCSPCKDEMADFNDVYLELGEDVQFLMVNMTDGQRETLSIAQDYVVKQEFSFPVYYDITQDAAYTYEVTSLPSTIFIDKEGYLTAMARGQISKDSLMEGIGMIK